MKIITTNNEQLQEICKKLALQIRNSDFKPSLILGIKTGGEKIAKILFNELQLENCDLDFCHPIRKSSLNKKSRFKQILKYLPLFFLNWLRKLEVMIFFKKNLRDDFLSIEFPDKLDKYERILLVDDAIDSGMTIKKIIEGVKSRNSNVLLKTAVITSTQKQPIVIPEFYIYNQTIIRFPWSIDAK